MAEDAANSNDPAHKIHVFFSLFLGGDSKTLMVVQVAPVEVNISETVCSLMFAQRVRAVELGQASKRVLDPTGEK